MYFNIHKINVHIPQKILKFPWYFKDSLMFLSIHDDKNMLIICSFCKQIDFSIHENS